MLPGTGVASAELDVERSGEVVGDIGKDRRFLVVGRKHIPAQRGREDHRLVGGDHAVGPGRGALAALGLQPVEAIAEQRGPRIGCQPQFLVDLVQRLQLIA